MQVFKSIDSASVSSVGEGKVIDIWEACGGLVACFFLE